jgi:hypothetical protein
MMNRTRHPTCILWRIPSIVAIASLCLALIHCARVDPLREPNCIDNLDCFLDEECVQHQCEKMTMIRPMSVVDLELAPLKGQGSSITQVPNLDLKTVVDISAITLGVDPSVLFRGEVISPFGPDARSGSILASRAPVFDSRHLTWNMAVDTQGQFSAELSPGTYTLLYKPTNSEESPQIALENVAVESKPNEDPSTTTIDIPTYPDPKDINEQITLMLVQGRVASTPRMLEPVVGIRVEGITDTGLRTNVSTTDADGTFYLRLPIELVQSSDGTLEKRYPQTLDVSLKPGTNTTFLPTVNIQDIPVSVPNLGTFFIGRIPPIRNVSGSVVGPDDSPISACSIQFFAENIGNGTYSESVQSNDDGTFAISLPAGEYKITIIPDLGSNARLENLFFTINSDIPDLTLSLPARLPLHGTVRDSSDAPLPDVTVRAERLSSVNGTDDTIYRLYEGTTGSDGNYSLLVDRGRYNVTFIPCAASRMPRSFPKRVYVKEDTLLDADLSPPAVIQGTVLNTLSEPMCGVTISIYHSDDTSSYLIGQSISSSAIEEECVGSFAAVIPGGFLFTP